MGGVSDISYFYLLGGAEGESKPPGGGEGDFFLENPRKGGGVSWVGGAGGGGAGRVFAGNLGGGGLNIFFSGPKFPPRKGSFKRCLLEKGSFQKSPFSRERRKF